MNTKAFSKFFNFLSKILKVSLVVLAITMFLVVIMFIVLMMSVALSSSRPDHVIQLMEFGMSAVYTVVALLILVCIMLVLGMLK